MACDAVELVLVGVIAGDCRVVLVVEELEDEPEDVVDEPVAADDADLEVLLAAARVLLAVVAPVVATVVAVRAWCGSAARAANRPTPATEPTATHPVAFRLRRNQALRSEGVVMGPSKTGFAQGQLSAPSAPRYKFLSARWEPLCPRGAVAGPRRGKGPRPPGAPQRGAVPARLGRSSPGTFVGKWSSSTGRTGRPCAGRCS